MRGLFADANASLLPKEAFDKGWRKVVVIVIMNVVIAVMSYLMYQTVPDKVVWMLLALIAADTGYLGINIKQRLNEMKEYVPILQDFMLQLKKEQDDGSKIESG